MRAYIRTTLEEYKAKLIHAELAEIPAIRSTFSEWYDSVSDEDRAEMEPFWNEIKKEAWEIINEVKELINEIKALDEAELATTRK